MKNFTLRKDNPVSRQFYNRRTKKFHLMEYDPQRGRFFCTDTQKKRFPNIDDVGKFKPETDPGESEPDPVPADETINETFQDDTFDDSSADDSGGGIFGGLF